MSNLIDFYEKVLNAYNMVVDREGFVSTSFMGEKNPKSIKDKRLVLPTKDVLRRRDIGELTVFHPIPEQLNQGESILVQDLVRLANIRFSYTLTALTLNIAWMISDTANHNKLSDNQTEIMLAIGSINKTRFKTIERVLAAVSKEASNKSMVSIYLRRGGTLHGKRHSCVSVVRFPLYEELSKPGDTLYGIKVKEEDRDLLQKILDYILPDIGVKDRYNAGTHSDFIPFLESLLNVTYLLGSKLNEVTAIMDGRFTDNDVDLMFDLGYYEMLTNNLDKILDEARRIPSQLDRPIPDQVPEPVVQQQAPMMPPPTMAQPNPYMGQPMPLQQPQYQQPQISQPSALNSDGTVNLHAALSMSQGPYQQMQPNTFMNNFVPPNQQYPMNNGYMNQQPMPMVPPDPSKPWQMSFGTGVNVAPNIQQGMQYNPQYGPRW